MDPLPPTVPVEPQIAPVVAEILAGTPLTATLGRQFGQPAGGPGGGTGRGAFTETTAQASYKSPAAQQCAFFSLSQHNELLVKYCIYFCAMNQISTFL